MKSASKCIGGLILCMVAAGAPLGWAADIYVDSDAPGSQTGTSWVNAYHYLQDALAVAQYGDIIKVGQGTYQPDDATVPSGLGRSSSFQLKAGVRLEGGYAGYSALPTWQWDERDPLRYPTVLSGDLSNNDPALDPNDVDNLVLLDTMAMRQDNCYNVVTASFVDRTCVLDGFIIEGGNANGTPTPSKPLSSGGGMVILQASPTIRNCRFVNCSALEVGGGLFVEEGDPNLVDCVFQANYCAKDGGAFAASVAEPNLHGVFFDRNVIDGSGLRLGGAFYCIDSNSTLDGCTFYGNGGAFYGGAIGSRRSVLTVSNSVFRANYASNRAGGVDIYQDSLGTLTNCRFINNTSRFDCGAVGIVESQALVMNSVFIGNSSRQDGGAMYCKDSDPNIVGCLFNGNVAEKSGGGVVFYQSTGLVSNCTFSANVATNGEALATKSFTVIRPSTVTVNNSLLWDSGNEIYNGDSSSLHVAYSGIQNGYPGDHNRRVNPQFVNAKGADGVAGNEDDDLRLSDRSDYIDNGNNHLVPLYHVEDLIHLPRFIDDLAVPDTGVGVAPIVDQGAYEYGDPNSLTPPVADAGEDITVPADAQGKATVLLDGSGSYDPNGDPIEYLWTWTVNLQPYSSTEMRPSVTLPVGQHLFTLVVYDGINTSEPDTVMVTVVSTGRPPTADAGPDQTVTLTSGSTVSVQLNGSGSSDPDGDPLQYQWSWMIGATPYQAVGVAPVVQLPLGTHVITLVVYDGIYYSSEDHVTIRVVGQNRAPVADAGPDQTVNAGNGGLADVTLNGSGSYDPDGDPLTYLWQWVVNSIPQQRTGVAPTIQLPVGQHTITLTVSDGQMTSPADTVVVTVTPPTNHPPVANAGPDQTVTLTSGSTAQVTLNGSGSSDPDGDPLQYVWSYTIGSQPYQANGVSPTIQLPAGVYTIQLVVFDGTDVSPPDTVVITVNQAPSNHPPVANAGPDRTVTITSGSTAQVTLNGSGSSDPDGDPLQYLWTWTIGSQSYQASGVTPAITLPVGTTTVQLVVFDGTDVSTPDTVLITVLLQPTNHPPVANAGPDQTVVLVSGSTVSVTLNGSGSSDPDGDPLQYIWSYTIGSQSYQATGVSPTIQLPVGVYTIQLVVFDGQAVSTPDTVIVTVTQANQRPVANAGPDQTQVLASGSMVFVTLDGSASYDPEGAPLSYLWTYTIGSVGYSRTGVSPTIQLPVGQHTITLVVSDGSLSSTPDTVVITVTQANQPPVANAGPDQSVTTAGSSASVTLDGTGSYDPDGSITQYLWTWTIGASNFQATGPTPTVQLPLGQTTISLVVSDGSLTSTPDTVVITVSQGNQAPVADAGPDQTVTVPAGQEASVTLDGTGSYDPDGTLSLYYWSWTVDSVTHQAYGPTPTVDLPIGVHVITLVVFDGTLTSSPDTVTITVNEATQGGVTVLSWPATVNRTDTSSYVLMFVTLPNTPAGTINTSVPLVLYPGGAQATQQHVSQQSDGSAMIFAMFDEETVLNSIPQNGAVPVTVFGQYNDGSLFVGETTLTLSH